MAVPPLPPFNPPIFLLCNCLKSPHSLSLSPSSSFSLSSAFSFLPTMKLIKINSKNFSPKRLFRRSKRDGSLVSRSEPPSFGSGSSSSSSSDSDKPGKAESSTPTSVLPQLSGDWSELSEMNLELVQAFRLIDRDNDGRVSRKELEALLSLLAAEPSSQEEVATMLGEVDGDGCVSLEALMSRVGAACGPACDSELRETFEIFDADHDGKITAEELFSVFATIGDERCTLEDCRRMIAGVDKNGDGFVCFEDFARMMEQQR